MFFSMHHKATTKTGGKDEEYVDQFSTSPKAAVRTYSMQKDHRGKLLC